MSGSPRPTFFSGAPLEEVLDELRAYADAGPAASRSAVGRAVTELEEALQLLVDFNVFDSVPNDHGYVGSPLNEQTLAFLTRNGQPAVGS